MSEPSFTLSSSSFEFSFLLHYLLHTTPTIFTHPTLLLQPPYLHSRPHATRQPGTQTTRNQAAQRHLRPLPPLLPPEHPPCANSSLLFPLFVRYLNFYLMLSSFLIIFSYYMNVDVTPKFNCYLYSKLIWVELGVKLNINKLGFIL